MKPSRKKTSRAASRIFWREICFFSARRCALSSDHDDQIVVGAVAARVLECCRDRSARRNPA
jgi:hypothetical protein